MKIKEFSIAIIFIILSLAVYSLFTVNGDFQQIVATLVFFVIMPLLFSRFIMKRGWDDFNLSVGDYKQGLIWSAYSLIVTGIIFFVISYFFGFLKSYTIPDFIVKSFWNFLFYEFIVVVPFVAVYEFYFRGFVMPILKSKLGYLAIALQAVIFLVLVLINNWGALVPLVPYFVFAPFAGLIAYKSKSILYSGASQFIILLVLTLIIIKKIG